MTAYDQNVTADVQLYSNGGSPQNAWRPVITSAPANVDPGNTYAISGKQFNGFSEGAAYGDDAQMATNYPLVRIINHATGHVFYARTHDHSRMGVELVGSNEIVTTQFDAPATLEAGASDLVVVANGIASQPIVITDGPALDHFKAYMTNGPVNGDTVLLQDQFDTGPVPKTVGQPFRFANPVQKTHNNVVTPITNPDTHLEMYILLPPEPGPTRFVQVNNQFGLQTLTVQDPVLLGVPTQKMGLGHRTIWTTSSSTTPRGIL